MSKNRDNRQGGLFQETRIDKETRKRVLKSESWIAQYYVDGKKFRKSTGTSVKSEAEKILRQWMGASERGEKAAPQTQGLMYENLRADLITHYQLKQHKSLKRRKDGTPYLFPLTALDNFFKGRRVNDIDRGTARGFVEQRRKDGASNSTINNSLRLLIRMFSLAQDSGKITLAPKFELLREMSRQGFLPPKLFQKLFSAIPARLQPMLLLLYHTGVRVGEAEKVEWSAVNLDRAQITLREGETKNDDPRILPISNPLVKLLSGIRNRSGRVFPSKRAMQQAFPKACKAVGIEGMKVHDLRRSAVRNMMLGGAQQAVAMKISGHKDPAVFQRYNVIDEQQAANVMGRVEQVAPVKLRRALPAKTSHQNRRTSNQNGRRAAPNGGSLVGVAPSGFRK